MLNKNGERELFKHIRLQRKIILNKLLTNTKTKYLIGCMKRCITMK